MNKSKNAWSIFWRMTLFFAIGVLPISFMAYRFGNLILDPIAFVYAKPTILFGVYMFVALLLSSNSESSISKFLWKGANEIQKYSKTIYMTYGAWFFMLALINLIVVMLFSVEEWIAYKIATSLVVIAIPIYIVLFKIERE